MKFAYLIEPPFNFTTSDGEVTGCDVELAKKVLDMIGISTFEPIEAEFAELLPGLGEQRWRMTTGLFATPERQNFAAFSRPVWALPDGMLVRSEDCENVLGYASLVKNRTGPVAVIRDQLQHRTVLKYGLPESRIRIFETYADAANAVVDGSAEAYISVARAHHGYLALNQHLSLGVVEVSADEQPPAFGCFGFHLDDDDLRMKIDTALSTFLGSVAHRRMMQKYGFGNAEIDLLL